MITPKEKTALAFTTHGVKLVRKSVKGIKPNPFLEKAFEQAKREGYTEAKEALAAELLERIKRSFK